MSNSVCVFGFVWNCLEIFDLDGQIWAQSYLIYTLPYPPSQKNFTEAKTSIIASYLLLQKYN
jgi:hypothetical protein